MQCSYTPGCQEPTVPNRKTCQTHLLYTRMKGRESALRNPDKRKDANRRNRLKCKTIAMQHYGNGMCACCGIDYLPYLQLDHINNDGKADREANGIRTGGGGSSRWYRQLALRGFPPGLQVLCANCHWAKTLKEPCLPHQ